MSGAYFTDQDPAFDGEKEATAILLGPVTASSGEMARRFMRPAVYRQLASTFPKISSACA